MPASPLTSTQKKYLRSLGHGRKPVLLVGAAGVTTAVIDEAVAALAAHELIKIRLRVGDRGERDAAIERLVRATDAELVQRVGHVALLYRHHPDAPRIILPSG